METKGVSRREFLKCGLSLPFMLLPQPMQIKQTWKEVQRQDFSVLFEQIRNMESMVGGEKAIFEDVKEEVLGRFKAEGSLVLLIGESHFELNEFQTQMSNLIYELSDKALVTILSERVNWKDKDSEDCGIVDFDQLLNNSPETCPSGTTIRQDNLEIFTINPEEIELAVDKAKQLNSNEVLTVYAGALHIGMVNKNNYLRDTRGVDGSFNEIPLDKYPQYAVALNNAGLNLPIINIHSTDVNYWLHKEAENFLYRVTRMPMNLELATKLLEKFKEMARYIEFRAQGEVVYDVPNQPEDTFLYFYPGSYSRPKGFWKEIANSYLTLIRNGNMEEGDLFLSLRGRHVKNEFGFVMGMADGHSFKMLKDNGEIVYYEFNSEGEYIGTFTPTLEDLKRSPFL